MECLAINENMELGEQLLENVKQQIHHDQQCFRLEARRAVSNFLNGYLEHQGVDPYTNDPVVLLFQCREINPRFYALDLPAITEYDDVNLEAMCIAAERTRDFVMQQMD